MVLTNRERFCRVYDGQPVDRPPRWEAVAFWQQTIDEWRAAGGLPDSVRNSSDAVRHFGIEPWPYVSGGLGFTNMALSGPPVEWRTVEEGEGTRVRESDLGAVIRERTDGAMSMPQFLRFPVESPQDWEQKIKPRLCPADHTFPGLDDEIACAAACDDPPVGLFLVGLYAFWRNFWGEEQLAYAFYDYPETLHDMARVWLNMHCRCTPHILDSNSIDWIMFHEDMAAKGGPLIGPEMFREFMEPHYRLLMDHLRGYGLHRFSVDSDGDNGPVLECFVEVGINGLFPFEVAAGSDAIAFREKHAEFLIFGAIDKRVLLRSREDIEREISEKVPVLWGKGRFVPSLDHSVPPCPQENFEFFLQELRRQFGG